MRRIARIVGLGVLGVLLVAAPVSAGKPTQEWIDGSETYVDPFLSDACGVEVVTTVTGHFITRTFSDAAGNPVRELNNYAFGASYTSANGSVRLRDVGVDRVSYLADGSIIQIIIGNVQSISIPGHGRVYADVGRTRVVITFDANGDPIFDVTPLGGQHWGDQLAVMCEYLGD